MSKLRVNLDYCINFRNQSRHHKKGVAKPISRPFEVVIKRNRISRTKADEVEQLMLEVTGGKYVYRYETAGKHYIEIRAYFMNFNYARHIRDRWIDGLNGDKHE